MAVAHVTQPGEVQVLPVALEELEHVVRRLPSSRVELQRDEVGQADDTQRALRAQLHRGFAEGFPGQYGAITRSGPGVVEVHDLYRLEVITHHAQDAPERILGVRCIEPHLEALLLKGLFHTAKLGEGLCIDRQIEVFGVARIEMNRQSHRANDRGMDFVLPQHFSNPLGHLDRAFLPIDGFRVTHLRFTSPVGERSDGSPMKLIRSFNESARSTRSRGDIAARRSNSRRRAASALLLGL
ncbi:hypothetical protein ACN28I_35325 [Archangium gephyra]|uniref:hypothetical protein n=1 Tax=Archangium gephyra TaxID=48 RepID=UPI003B7F20CE